MKRLEKIDLLLEPLLSERFNRSMRAVEKASHTHGEMIARAIVAAFQTAFGQAAALQSEKKKGKIRYLVVSHLYSSIYTGSYQFKLDIFDHNFYGDRYAVDAYLNMSWLYEPLEEDLAYFCEKLLEGQVYHLSTHEIEYIRYQYVWNYHSAALMFLSNNLHDLLMIPEFQKLDCDDQFQVLFGGYMDRAVVIGGE